MNPQTLSEFLAKTTDRKQSDEPWELESQRILEVKLSQEQVWIKAGAMIAYRGGIKFTREGLSSTARSASSRAW